MNITLDKENTTIALKDQVKADMKEFKARYTDSDLRRAFEDALDYGKTEAVIDLRKVERNTVTDDRGDEINFNAAVALMDDEIRERLHREMAPCTDQEFFDAYLEAHFEKYGEEFRV